jgi:hypothetical protein
MADTPGAGTVRHCRFPTTCSIGAQAIESCCLVLPRYICHREQGYTPLLFVREQKNLSSGRAASYTFLGPADHVSHEGSRPISIVWRLRYPMPARMLRPFARQKVG